MGYNESIAKRKVLSLHAQVKKLDTSYTINLTVYLRALEQQQQQQKKKQIHPRGGEGRK